MSSISPLIVPINVEAWCASPLDVQAGVTRSAPAANFSVLPSSATDTLPYLSESVIASPFATDSIQPLAGIHLHWALPDALTRSTQRYQLTAQAINQLRLLGLPLAEQSVLAAYLANACSADTTIADLASQLLATPAAFSFAAWASALAVNSIAIVSFATPEAFLGLEDHAADSMASVLGAASTARHQSILLQACGVAQFPAAPNRWLLIRTVTSDVNLTMSQWRARIVESDFVTTCAQDCFARLALPEGDPRLAHPEAYATSIPADPETDGVAYRFIGRACELSGWHEDTTAARFSPLTALGWGLPSFAASYVDCSNVFGHCDELGDLGADWPLAPEQTRLSYAVIGWHSDPAQDPLASALPDALRWVVAGAKGGDPVPVRSLYAGMIYDIQWDPNASYSSGGEAPGDTSVVVANNAAEALATLLGTVLPIPGLEPISTADLLEALQLGLLDQLTLDGPSGLAKLESALHSKAFGAAPGGKTWGIVPKNATASESGVTLPAKLARALDSCNVAQQAWEAQNAVIASKRSRLFAAWHLFLALSVPPPGAETGAEQQFREDRLAILRKLLVINSGDVPEPGALPAGLADLLTLSDQLASAVADLTGALGPDYKVVMSPGTRFWRPTEPVILFAGAGAQPSLRFGTNGLDRPDGMLRTRLLANILSSTALAKLTNSVHWPLADTIASGLGSMLAAANSLLCEALILDGDMSVPGPDRTALLEQVAVDADADTPSYSAIPGFGQPPTRNAINQRGTSGTANPWHPVALHWQIQLRPQQSAGAVGGDYAPDILLTKTQLDPANIDLSTLQRPDPGIPAEQFHGIALLSGRAQQTLAAQARTFLAEGDFPDPLEKLLRAWETRNMPLLSQSLSGFNDALLMRTQQLQLRVWSPNNAALAAPAAVWIGSANHGAPKPVGAFNPLRFGVMNVDALRLIDCFGQIRDVRLDTQVPLVARSLQGPPAAPGDHGFEICLPPRLAQAARLRLRWRSAADDSLESNDHPATSPICGWMLSNHLDQSLMIFDASGTECGALRVRTGAANPDWLASPWASEPTSPSNPNMAAFVAASRALSGDKFAAFMATLQRMSLCIVPAGSRNHNPMAALMGQPIALARLTFGLDVDGLTANDPSAAALDGVTSWDFAAIARTAGVENIAVPVRLGDIADTDDGLFGFFQNDDYDTFIGADAAQPLQVTLAGRPQTVSALLDPRGSVHATSGVLPVQTLRVPDDQYKRALEAMSYSFLAAPILGHDLAAVSLPLPGQTTKPWVWLQVSPTGRNSQTPTAPDARARLDVGPRTVREGFLAIANLDKFEKK